VPKRGDRVAPPPGPSEWDVRFGDAAAVNGWELLAGQAPGPTRTAWMNLRSEPRARSERQHPLKGALGTRSVGGRVLDRPQWQLEVTGAGRIWYAIDDQRRTVIPTMACVGHPKAAE
jgi:hypothetical protein